MLKGWCYIDCNQKVRDKTWNFMKVSGFIERVLITYQIFTAFKMKWLTRDKTYVDAWLKLG